MAQRHIKNLKWFNEQYKKIGYDIELAKSGHFKVYDPEGKMITTIASSPSDHRAGKNAQAFLRRHEANRQAIARVHAAAVKA